MNDIRVVSLMEGDSASRGPVKKYLQFVRQALRQDSPACAFSVVAFVRGRKPSPTEMVTAFRDAGIPVDIIWERRRFDVSTFGQLRRILAVRSPVLVESHGVKSHFLLRCTRPAQVPWLAFHSGYTAEDLKMRAYNEVNRWSLPAADRVITPCHPFADVLIRQGVRRERIRVMPCAIDPRQSRFDSPAPPWVQTPRGARVILSIGRLSHEKGHRDLISAARILSDRRPDLWFVLVLVGDGPERGRLERQAEAAGMRDRVRFTGYLADALACYRWADVMVLPSYSEGSPNVLLEAMLAGTPIIACDVGGVPETVEDGVSALLVRPRDPEALGAAIARVLSDPLLAARLGKQALTRVLDRNSPQAYCRSLLRVYEEVALHKSNASNAGMPPPGYHAAPH